MSSSTSSKLINNGVDVIFNQMTLLHQIRFCQTIGVASGEPKGPCSPNV